MSVTNITVLASLEVMKQWNSILPCAQNDEGLTSGELAESRGMHKTNMVLQLNRLVREGQVIKGYASRETSSGFMRRVPVYRPTPKPDNKNAS